MGTQRGEFAIQEVPHFIDRIPKDRDGRGDHKRTDHQGRNAFQLTMTIGMFVVRRFLRQAA